MTPRDIAQLKQHSPAIREALHTHGRPVMDFLRSSVLISPDFKTYITALAYAHPTYDNPKLRNDPHFLYCPAPWDLRAWNDDPDYKWLDECEPFAWS